MSPVARVACPLCAEGVERPPLADRVRCPKCGVVLDVAELSTARGRPRFVAQTDLAGERLGPYRLVERLGAGGAGTVYRATDQAGAPVALKVLDPSLAPDEAARQRFRREATLLSELAHPRIVRLRDHGEDNGVPWIAMEYVEGADLRARLRRGPLDRRESADLFAGLLDGLAFAHERGIVHRDIKPGNILLGLDGPRLADFGIARAGGVAETAYLTATEAVLGTLLYMAPEQRDGGPVDARADLFSVGVVLYEALTGRLPQGAFAPPSKMARGLPSGIDPVVLRLLQPDPAARYASAEEAAAAIRRALQPRRTRAVVVGSSAGLVIAAVAAFVGYIRSNVLVPTVGAAGGARPAPISVAPPAPSVPPVAPALAGPVALPSDDGMTDLGIIGKGKTGGLSVGKKPPLEVKKTPSLSPLALKIAEKKVAEKKVAEKKVAEKKVAEKKVAEKKVAEKKVAEKKVAEKKVAEKKAAEIKAAQRKVVPKAKKPAADDPAWPF